MSSRRAALAAALLAALCACTGAGKIRGGPPKAASRREDVPLIRCAVCGHLARAAHDQAAALLATRAGGARVDEAAVIDRMELLTTAWREEGEWLTRLHLEGSGASLKVKDMRAEGECGEACKTLERAALDVMGDHDADVGEALYGGRRSRKEFERWMCHDLTKACGGGGGGASAGSGRAYAPFARRAPGEQNLDRMMGQMEASGMGGRLYSRDSMAEEMLEEMGGEEGVEALGLGADATSEEKTEALRARMAAEAGAAGAGARASEEL
jgi:hypothetical protein